MTDAQTSLFDASVELPAASPDAKSQALGARLSPNLRLGTSSWHFPGWQGLVWADEWPAKALSRHGLTAYAQHPLLRTVSVDRTYYAPIDVAAYRDYADQVDTNFRFIVKTWSQLTEPQIDGRRNDDFLDPDIAERVLLTPVVQGLGAKLGLLHLQFSPRASDLAQRYRDRFLTKLDTFLSALTEGPLWSVEFRHPSLYEPEALAMLKQHQATPCLSVHPSLPDIESLAEQIGTGWPALSIRWNLGGRQRYESAKARYAPFNRLVDPDEKTRATLARLATDYVQSGKEVIAVANNKAEGSAPLTLRALAEAIDQLQDAKTAP